MNQTAIIRVLQVHHNVGTYAKGEHNSGNRAHLPVWNEVVDSNTGYSKADAFVIPDSTVGRIDQLVGSNVIILNDFNSTEARENSIPGRNTQKAGVALLNMRNNSLPFEIFKIRQTPEGFDLCLDYANTRWYIGRPYRANYKLSNLLVGKPVRVTINGKRDFSGSGREMRNYSVRDYMFEYLGEFSDIVLIDPDRISVQKKIPLSTAKQIDLRKVLF